MFDHKVFKSSNETVSKYVFACPTAVAETLKRIANLNQAEES